MSKLFKILVFSSLVLNIIALQSCGSNNDGNRDEHSRELFEKTMKLTRTYTDSLLHAKDSTAVYRMTSEYENAVTHLNYEYSPQADIDISEGENDTIISLTLRYLAVKDSVLKRFANKTVITDSISRDTIP